MKELLANITELFDQLIASPNKIDEFASKLKELLNNNLGNERNFKPVECENVFVSKSNADDPFYIIVVPTMPITGNSILAIDYIFSYDVDIDADSILTNYNKNGLNAAELAAWFMHELYSNVLTDATFTRYKKLLITHYDTHNKAITAAHNNLGYMSWFGVYTNTIKDKIDDSTNDTISNNLKLLEIQDDWNRALDKFVMACGGDYTILTREYNDRADKACLEQFNKLARKYSAYVIKYANSDWRTLTKYMCANIGSECLKYYITKEPDHIAAIAEKNVYDVFDSRKLLRETFENEENIQTPGNIPSEVQQPEDITKLANAEIYSTLENLTLDVQNVTTLSEKLYTAAKLKDFIRLIEDRLLDDSLNETLLSAREQTFQLANKLAEIDVSEVSELEVR